MPPVGRGWDGKRHENWISALLKGPDGITISRAVLQPWTGRGMRGACTWLARQSPSRARRGPLPLKASETSQDWLPRSPGVRDLAPAGELPPPSAFHRGDVLQLSVGLSMADGSSLIRRGQTGGTRRPSAPPPLLSGAARHERPVAERREGRGGGCRPIPAPPVRRPDYRPRRRTGKGQGHVTKRRHRRAGPFSSTSTNRWSARGAVTGRGTAWAADRRGAVGLQGSTPVPLPSESLRGQPGGAERAD